MIDGLGQDVDILLGKMELDEKGIFKQFIFNDVNNIKKDKRKFGGNANYVKPGN